MADGYQETFAERGDAYDSAMHRWPGARDDEFGFALGLARPVAGELVVDVPAGGGYLAGHLPEGVRYLGVEPTGSLAAGAGLTGADVLVAPLAPLPAPAADADVVISVAGVHHEPDQAQLYAAWRRSLRPGGRLVVADVAVGSAPAAFLEDVVHRWTATGHRGIYLGDDLQEVVEAAGYVDVAVTDGEYCWWGADEEAVAGFCRALFGMADAPLDVVRDALADGLGFVHDGDRVGLRWGLRAVIGRNPG